MSGYHRLFTRACTSILGMVHVRPLPGTPLNTLNIDQIINTACDEASILKHNNVDALIVENMYDVPYTLTPGPEILACMSVVCSKIRDLCPRIPIGVQILAGDNTGAMAVAKAAGLDFIRCEGFVFGHVGDEGWIQSCAGRLLRYRRQINADNVCVFTDIKKKHSSHAVTDDVPLEETARAAEFFLSDAVIVTGTATGSAAKPDDIDKVKAASQLPVLVGSGVTQHNLNDYMSADGLIIGSHFKKDDDWRNELDENRIKEFMTEFTQRHSD